MKQDQLQFDIHPYFSYLVLLNIALGLGYFYASGTAATLLGLLFFTSFCYALYVIYQQKAISAVLDEQPASWVIPLAQQQQAPTIDIQASIRFESGRVAGMSWQQETVKAISQLEQRLKHYSRQSSIKKIKIAVYEPTPEQFIKITEAIQQAANHKLLANKAEIAIYTLNSNIKMRALEAWKRQFDCLRTVTTDHECDIDWHYSVVEDKNLAFLGQRRSYSSEDVGEEEDREPEQVEIHFTKTITNSKFEMLTSKLDEISYTTEMLNWVKVWVYTIVRPTVFGESVAYAQPGADPRHTLRVD